jgi:hypothetical protein
VRICVDLAGAPDNSSCTTSGATIRDVFHVYVGLDGLKNEKVKVFACTTEKAKIVRHGHQQPRRDFQFVGHGNFSRSEGNSRYTTQVGKPIIYCAIGTSCYNCLCDIWASLSVIPYCLYLDIKPGIDPIHMEKTGITI